MPSSPFSVWINILGSVSPSVALSIGAVNKGLIGLQATAVATNTVLSTLGRGLGLIAGIGGGLLAIGSIAAGYREAIKLSMENEQIQELTLQILKNQRAYRHQNVELARQDLDLLNRQAVYLQEHTGIYKNIFERGSLILAQTGRTKQEIVSLNASIANLLVSQTMQGKSAESLTSVYEAVGKAIETGMARNLNSVGIILTKREKQLLSVYAWQHKYNDSIRLIENAINRRYGGDAARRMGTLTGQTALALTHMRQSLEHMGDALKPIQQRFTIIFSKIVTLFEPLVVRVANLVNSFMERHMKDIEAWVGLIQSKVIPIMVEWIDRGWKAIIIAIGWIKKNKDWLVPLVLGAAAGLAVFVALAGAISAIAAVVAIVTDPIVLLAGAFMAVGAGIALVWKNWKTIGPALTNFASFVKGGVESGWKALVDWVSNKAWIGLKTWVSNAFNWIADTIRNWIGVQWQNFTTWSKRIWESAVAGMKLVGTAMWNFILSPFNWLYNRFLDFLRLIHVLPSGKLTDPNAVVGGGGLTRGGGASTSWDPASALGGAYIGGDVLKNAVTKANATGGAYIGGGVVTNAITNAPAKYAKWVDILTEAGTKYNIDPRLLMAIAMQENVAPGDLNPLGISPHNRGPTHFANMEAARQGILRQVALISQGLYQHTGPFRDVKSIADLAAVYSPPNAPNDPKKTNITEPFGVMKYYKKLGGNPQTVLGSGTTPQVTINYNVHHHGDTDEHTFHHHHRRHLDRMKRELSEIIYRNNRASFDGAVAV